MSQRPISDGTEAIAALLAYGERMESDTPTEPLWPDLAEVNVRLRAELAAAKAQLVTKTDELAAMRQQRDEARERYCAEAARHSVCRRSIMDKQTIAQMNGWQGLWKEGGGA